MLNEDGDLMTIDIEINAIFGNRTIMYTSADYLVETLVHTHMWVITEAVRSLAQDIHYEAIPSKTMLALALISYKQFKGLERVCLYDYQPKHDLDLAMSCEHGLAALFG